MALRNRLVSFELWVDLFKWPSKLALGRSRALLAKASSTKQTPEVPMVLEIGPLHSLPSTYWYGTSVDSDFLWSDPLWTSILDATSLAAAAESGLSWPLQPSTPSQRCQLDVNAAFQDDFGPSPHSLSPSVPDSSHVPPPSPFSPNESGDLREPSTANSSCLISAPEFRECVVSGCGQKFRSASQLRKHISEKHRAKRFKCDRVACPSFADARSLTRHLQTSKAHTRADTSQLQCRCAKSFTRWDKFKSHFLKCQLAETATYKCLCGQAFDNHIAIEQHHKDTHMGKRGRPCKRN
ncbi:hypothetical protein GQ44DRAFT_780280 [Phaeosphaeriaceae sp. PMI808]|nr:hypothetical protein GQ44DRAFT_780280 [Phaeosphaeriaceae sp. PMI808]